LSGSAAAVKVFVNVDQRVLVWGQRGSVRIVSPRQAWETLVMLHP